LFRLLDAAIVNLRQVRRVVQSVKRRKTPVARRPGTEKERERKRGGVGQ